MRFVGGERVSVLFPRWPRQVFVGMGVALRWRAVVGPPSVFTASGRAGGDVGPWGDGDVGALMLSMMVTVAFMLGAMDNGGLPRFTCGAAAGKRRIRDRAMCAMRGNGCLRPRLGRGCACGTSKDISGGRMLG